jgi:DeoR/GlpR family transcriptional regulator of sugar metabolism
MTEPLFLEERRQLIVDTLKREGRVSVKALSDVLKVSEVTIRQDLRALEEEGVLERTYGGAMLRSTNLTPRELAFDVRMHRATAEKEHIGQAAAALVQDGYSLAIDASSTTYAMTPFLKRYDGLTIVTNSLVIAQQFLDTPRIRVLLPGGRLRRDSISLVGEPGTLPDINLNLGFFGARGVSYEEGITELNPEEAEMKRAMMSRCRQVVILADGSKWGQVGPYTYADRKSAALILTSTDAPEPMVAQFRQAGVRVERVEGA